MKKCYQELSTIDSLRDRYNYLKLSGGVSDRTFGGYRSLNQDFYRSPEWKRVRKRVIARDGGNELGMNGYPIKGDIFVHHIRPITINDVIHHSEDLLDEDNLISVGFEMHNALHYGTSYDDFSLSFEMVERKPDDTCPWKGGGTNA